MQQPNSTTNLAAIVRLAPFSRQSIRPASSIVDQQEALYEAVMKLLSFYILHSQICFYHRLLIANNWQRAAVRNKLDEVGPSRRELQRRLSMKSFFVALFSRF